MSKAPLLAANSERRQNPNPDPWNALLPLFEMMFTAPVDVRSVLTSNEDCDIPNSSMDSFERFITVVPTVSSVMSTPST